MNYNEIIEDVVKKVVGAFVQQFPGEEYQDLVNHLWLRILHGKETTYKPERSEFRVYARAVANREIYRYVAARRCPVHGRSSDAKKWRGLQTCILEDYLHPREPSTPETSTSFRELTDCLQKIFDEHQHGAIAREVLIEQLQAQTVADRHQVTVDYVYNAVATVRAAIKANPNVQLLWETT